MQIYELGGEFALIKRIIGHAQKSSDILVPNGHDACVLQFGDRRLVVTTDTIVESRHFSLEYWSAEDVGMRALEGATSDIFAVGGVPRYFLVALVLPAPTVVSFVDGFYQGLAESAARLGMVMVGGDTNSGTEKISATITVLGELPANSEIISRAGAKVGDEILLSGGLGGSLAGLKAFQARLGGQSDVKNYHIRPKCRNDVAADIAKVATSMIDISDGLSSEIGHVCSASMCGAEIYADLIPIKPGVKELAAALGVDALELALHGGEEFELLYTARPGMTGIGTKIGVIKAGSSIELVNGDKRQVLLPAGFNHFKNS